jgi:hypothetical protein
MRNRNGLTFAEWMASAGKDAQTYGSIRLIWYYAWEGGEDPCEWKGDRVSGRCHVF